MPTNINNYFKKNEETNFKLCENIEKVINSKTFKFTIYNILNSEFSDKVTNEYYNSICNILSEGGGIDDSNSILELLDNSKYKEKFELKGDDFVNKNIVSYKTTTKIDLKASEIITLLQNKSIANKFNYYFNLEKNELLLELYKEIKVSSNLYEEVLDNKDYYIIRNNIKTYLIDKTNYTLSRYIYEKIDGTYYLLLGENNNYCVIYGTKNKIYRSNSKIKPIISMEISIPVEITVVINTGNEIKLLDENFEVKSNYSIDKATTLRNQGIVIKKDGLYAFIDLQGRELVSGIKGEIYIKNNNLYEKRKLFFDKQLNPDYN